MKKIKVGIVGFGNLGKSVFENIKQNKEFKLVGVFTRRHSELKNKIELFDKCTKIESLENILNYKNKIDVLILCGGSYNDVTNTAYNLIKHFCLVDSFDTHAKISNYIKRQNVLAKKFGQVAVCSCGWDPGLFSIIRAINYAILPGCTTNTFWGKGVSQGHSNAIKSINGVFDAIEYTVPKIEALSLAEKGVEVLECDKHLRECFVVCEKQNQDKIESAIKTMPNYFAGYQTKVNFVSNEEFLKHHKKQTSHAGQVISTEKNQDKILNQIKYSLNLSSNANFTAKVMLAYARACYKLKLQKKFGAYSVLDIAPNLMLPICFNNYVAKFV